MKIKQARKYSAVITTLSAVFLLSGTRPAHATAFPTLDPARNFALLALNGNIQQSGPTPPSGANQFNVDGNIGVASAGFKYQGSGSVNISGDFYINTGSTFQTSSSGTRGVVIQNAATDTLLANARTAAINTSAMFAVAPANQTFGTLSGSTTISQSTVGNYIFNISSINLSSNDAITLSAPAGSTFVLNVTGAFSLSGSSHIQLAGGLTAGDVLYNALGTGNVQFSGGGNSSGVTGIILAVDRNVQLSPALIIGEVIGRSISLSSGASVIGVVPEMNTVLMVPVLLGLMLLGSLRRFARKTAA